MPKWPRLASSSSVASSPLAYGSKLSPNPCSTGQCCRSLGGDCLDHSEVEDDDVKVPWPLLWLAACLLRLQPRDP